MFLLATLAISLAAADGPSLALEARPSAGPCGREDNRTGRSLPIGNQTVEILVEAAYGRDPGTGIYTYSYSVTNLASSRNPLDAFGLSPTAPARRRLATGLARLSRLGRRHGSSCLECHRPRSAAGRRAGESDLRRTEQPSPRYDDLRFPDRQPSATECDRLLRAGIRHAAGRGTFCTSCPACIALELGYERRHRWPASLGAVPASTPPEVPSKVRPQPDSPSPTSHEVTIAFCLLQPAEVEISIFDESETEVRRLADGLREAGMNRVTWDGKDSGGNDLIPGVYSYRMRMDEVPIGSQRMIVLP